MTLSDSQKTYLNNFTYSTCDTNTSSMRFVDTAWTDSTTTATTSVNPYPTAVFNVLPYSTVENWTVKADQNKMIMSPGSQMTIELPDGTILEVDEKGNYKINDKDAKVVYQAKRCRGFNKYLNASDLLEEFIRFLGTIGGTQEKVLDVPIELFINWIIVRSAEEDEEEIPEGVQPLDKYFLPPNKRWNFRCRLCGRFISKMKQSRDILFCNPSHFDLYYQKYLLQG